MSRLRPRHTPIWALAALLAWGLAPDGSAAHGLAGRLCATLRCDLRNRADYERLERGYYECLVDAGPMLGPSVEPGSNRATWARLETAPFEAGPLATVVPDLREFVLKPNLSIVHDGARWSTNSLGMRDREYAATKPPGTFRIAVVGDSIGAGWGVNDGEAFESAWERALDERSRRAGGPKVEVLNFAVPGHGPGQRWEHFTRVGWALEPDLVVFEATQADAGWDERRLRGLLARGVGWDCRAYRGALDAAGARPGTAETYKRVLKPYRERFLTGVYTTAADDCRARRVPCVWVLVPRVGKVPDPAGRRKLLDQARASGFAAVIDLSDTYDGIDPTTLAIGADDYHPNADGHARGSRAGSTSASDRAALAPLGNPQTWASNAPTRGGDRR